MIIVVLFLIIAAIVVSLNIYDSSNLNKIEEYLKSQNCSNLVYSKGSYKAFCQRSIKEVSNSFSLDLKKNTKEYFYKDIKNIEVNKLDLKINDINKLSFKDEKKLNSFYMMLDEKINNRNTK